MTVKESKPQIQVLEPSPKGNEWLESERDFSVDDLADFPKQCYLFLDSRDYPPADGRRQKLLAHFNVPEFVANRTCFELNGYFGSKAQYGGQRPEHSKHVTSYSTWFRCLVKMIKKVDEEPHEDGPEYVKKLKKGYQWFEMSFFTRWDYPNSCQVLCVDTPPDLRSELKKVLEKQPQGLDFRDPFAMLPSIVDQIIVYTDVAVWRVRDPVRLLEKTRMRTGAIFGPIHEVSRHALHTSEVLEAAIDIIKELQARQEVIHEKLHLDLGETYREQSKEYAQFQISALRSLKLRSDSNLERLKNEIDLAFNNMSRQDNSVMKTIALLGMIFLPATFISAIFSTTFFNFGDDGNWEVSNKLWIYWATTIPATIAAVVLWQFWLSNGDAITKFLGGVVKWSRAPWGKRAKQKEQVSGKVGQA